MTSRSEWWHRKKQATAVVEHTEYVLKGAYVLGAKLRRAGEKVQLTEHQAQSLKLENVI